MKLVKFLVIAVLGAALNFAVCLLGAQFVVWGLSDMHVNSGIWGPYLILAGIGMVTTVAISSSGRK